mmetsp:Transcript_37282/g.49044  ORF Transcript_37282/g.49044 Transcript_37282/m.49044 type:complete len:95 (+) Transcript_37282:491-775(+)|eukprot:CAMPEP_0185595286 /NCGR_PEP_ID=MMETSP0434-20130131/77883_1 /TAXON_ID=626734 ORGANISM="Favella taraikaensis, Strain Fe Narragansett Bay" /NCGR_SAMPLE_ID=MMETSP0434 /ASSEMBLY_ACC=CAM_ASM_000379 /LENGTH=94 /DNA_ID=CAMNT_0028223193 /DNA_START=399 /DNA_END=683 /DNA_ORIENTATION=-
MDVDDDFGIKRASASSGAGKGSAVKMMNPEDGEYDHVSQGGGKRSGRRSARALAEAAAEEDLGCWGDTNKPFVGFKMASITLRKLKKRTPEQLE